MNYKYNAFISYKHAPLDSAVAEYIINMLEHMSISSDTKKEAAGHLHDGKLVIFRDLEELYSTGNLTQTLMDNIDQSEHLIVILSKSTCQSGWVSKEIDHFLLHHDRKNIHPIIIEGEKDDVLPVQFQEVEPYISMCQGKNLKEIKKRLQEEKQKIAAPMLGMEHVSLEQRQKAYRMKRLAIASMAAVFLLTGFLVYAFIQNSRISEEYRKAQIAQSRYLANTSISMLEKGDRISALQLALAAVPESVNDKKPLVDEAYYALNRAMYSYHQSGFYEFYPLEQMEVSSSPKGTEKTMQLSPEQEKLLLVTANGEVNIFDLESRRMILYGYPENLYGKSDLTEGIPDAFDHESSFLSGVFATEDEVILFSDLAVYRYSIAEEKFLWKYEYPHSEEGSYQLETQIQADNIFLMEEKNLLVFVDNQKRDLYKLNSNTGLELSEPASFPYEASDMGNDIHLTASSDGSYILLYKVPRILTLSTTPLTVYILNTASLEVVGQNFLSGALLDLILTDEYLITLCAGRAEQSKEGSEHKLPLITSCYKLSQDSPKPIWEKTVTVNCSYSDLNIRDNEYLSLMDASSENPKVLIGKGKNLFVYQLLDGTEVISYTSENSFIAMERQEASEHRYYTVSEEGKIEQLVYSDSSKTFFEYTAYNSGTSFKNALFSPRQREWYLLDSATSSVWIASNSMNDESGTLLDIGNSSVTSYGYRSHGDHEYRYLLLRDADNGSNTLRFYELGEKDSFAMSDAYDKIEFFGLEYLKDDQIECSLFKAVEGKKVYLCALDLKSNKLFCKLPYLDFTDSESLPYSTGQYGGFYEDKVLMLFDKKLTCINLVTGESKDIPLDESEAVKSLSLSAKGLAAISLLDADPFRNATRLRFYDLNTDSWVMDGEIPIELVLKESIQDSYPVPIFSPSGDQFAVLHDSNLAIFDSQYFTKLQTISHLNLQKGLAAFIDEDKLVLYADDSHLKVYSIEESAYIYTDPHELPGMTSIQVIQSTVGVICSNDIYSSDSTLFRLGEDGTLSRYLYIKGGLCSFNTREVLTLYTESKQSKIYFYPDYELDKLVLRAKEILGDRSLSNLEKQMYFITE